MTLSASALAALFAALFLIALMPGTSVFVVSTRAATSGLRHGVWAALGIVVADLLFILAAVLGLTLLIRLPEPLHVALRVAGAAYLTFLGLRFLRSPASLPTGSLPVTFRRSASFAMGFLLTLIDLKAIVFYLGFLPAFLDLKALTRADTALLLLTAAISVGSAKMAYAIAAARGAVLVGPRGSGWIRRAAGVVLLLAAVLLVAGMGIRPAEAAALSPS